MWQYDGNLTRIAQEFYPFPPAYVHADKHIITFDPNNPQLMYVGTDGGIFKSFDQGGSFYAANKGYNVTQFYSVAYGNPSSAGIPTPLMGGSQDNGTQFLPGIGSSPLQSSEVMGGDGFNCDISSITGALFATIYNGDLRRSQSSGIVSFSPICGTFCDATGVFNTVTRLWESKGDITSRDSIVFTVDTIVKTVGTGNGSDKKFEGKKLFEILPSLQPSAELVIGSLRIQVGTNGINFNDWANTSKDTSIFGSGGNTCTIYYKTGELNKTGELTVSFAQAISVNTPVRAYFTVHYDAGKTLLLESNTEKVPVYHTLTQDLDYGNTITVQDPVQSLLALGVNQSQGGVVITRYGLRFDATVDSTWIRLNTAGVATCIEFSKDGNHMFVGVANSVYRVSGLNNVYTQGDVSPDSIKQIFSNASTVTGIAVDYDNPQNVVVTVGNYGHAGYVYLTNNAVSATAPNSFWDVTGDMPLMPVYDAEFINHSSKVIVGTEFGIYSTLNIFAGSVQWTNENNGVFPHMPVYEVRQQKFWPSSNYEMLFVGTHGRGMWESGSLVTGMDEPLAGNAKTKFISGVSVYPNPVMRGGFVTFDFPKAGTGNIRVYDLNGRNVKSILKQPFAAGANTVKLDVENLPAGTYFVTVETGGVASAAKFIVVK